MKQLSLGNPEYMLLFQIFLSITPVDITEKDYFLVC